MLQCLLITWHNMHVHHRGNKRKCAGPNMKERNIFSFGANKFDSLLASLNSRRGTVYVCTCTCTLHVFRRKPRFRTAWNTLVAEQIVVLSCSCAADVRNCSYLSGTDDTVVAGELVSNWSQLCLKEHEWSRDSCGILNRRQWRKIGNA